MVAGPRRFAQMVPLWDIAPELPQNPLAGATQELERSFAPAAGGQTRDPRRLVPAPLALVKEEEAA